MPIVYRIERSKTEGLYSSKTAFSFMCERERHPDPNMDGALCEAGWNNLNGYVKNTYFFGFRSKAQLKSWIYRKEWRQALEDEGYYVTRFQCDDVIKGNTQCVFRGPRRNEKIIPWEEL